MFLKRNLEWFIGIRVAEHLNWVCRELNFLDRYLFRKGKVRRFIYFVTLWNYTQLCATVLKIACWEKKHLTGDGAVGVKWKRTCLIRCARTEVPSLHYTFVPGPDFFLIQFIVEQKKWIEAI